MISLPILVHLMCNLFMLAVIMFVQRVHYPTFVFVSPQKWKEFHAFHCRRTGQIVTLPMAFQVVSLFLISDCPWPLYVFNLLSIGTTAAVSMRLHNKLTQEFSRSDLNGLLKSDWIRILGWLGAVAQTLLLFRFQI
jgi:hypothetical protein